MATTPPEVDLAIDLDLIQAFAQPDFGVGGWQAQIIQQFKNMIEGTQTILLGRKVSLSPSTLDPGSILFTVPSGYSAFVEHVIVRRVSSTPSAASTYLFGNDGQTPYVYEWNTGVSGFEVLTSANYLLKVLPYPGNEITGQVPDILPILSGDDANRDSFYVKRSGGSGISLDWWVYGRLWPNP